MRSEWLPGGFVGVDIFFVLSGFLISSHLIHELQTKGKIEFSKFWARRAKRLLPASFTVLGVTALAVWFFAPFAFQDRYFRDIAAATAYFANWVFAFDSVDYLAADNSPSVVQHFWSLGVEEQLYIGWPLLLSFAWLVGLRRAKPRITLAAMLTLVLAFSIIYSSLLVFDADPVAYFSTFSRAWEFASGGLLALYLANGKEQKTSMAKRNLIATLSWFGLVAFMFLFQAEYGFPGLGAVIPVVLTVAIIWVRDPIGYFRSQKLLHLKPVQFVGDASYSIYLWHWPLLIFGGFYLPGLSAFWLAVIFVVTLILSALSMKFIENPFRFGKLKTSLKPKAVFAMVASSMLVLISSSQAAGFVVRQEAELQAAAEKALEEQIAQSAAKQEEIPVWDEFNCMGPNFLVVPECADFTWDVNIPAIKSGEETAHDIEPLERFGSDKGCLAWGESYKMLRCIYGVKGGTKIALIGDSHAYHWIPAFDAVAKQNNYELHFLARAGCPYNTVPREGRGEHVRGCFSWMSEVRDFLESNPSFEYYIMANFVGSRFEGSGAFGAKQPNAIEGYKNAWSDLAQFGAKILVMKDTPFIGEEAWNCAVTHSQDYSQCDVTEKEMRAIIDNAALAAADLNYPVLNFDKYFCKDGTCPLAIGGIRVYRDSNHMTGTFNQLLAPYLSKELEAIVAQ